MKMRGWCVAGAGSAAALLVLTGCSGSRQAPSAAPASSAPASNAAPKSADPLKLVGSWNVLTPAGLTTHDYLRIGDDLELSPPCGVLLGTWSANAAGTFVAETHGGSSGCFTAANGGGRAPAWLTAAAAFKIEGSTRILLDGSGHVLARLSPGRGLYRAPNLAQLRARLATAPPLPREQAPVTATMMLGRWEPIPITGAVVRPGQKPPASSFVTFAADGTWSGSDGCNAQGGRYRVDDAGALVVTAGPSTLVGCVGFPVGTWMSQVRRAGRVGRELTLLDGQGHEIAQLFRT
jgi:hypothetical protein